MKHRFTAALERFSRAMLAPLTYLSAAGLLLAAGALLTSTALSGALPLLQWGPVRLMGRILYKCLSAVISNLSVLFCTGLAASLAKQEKHQAAFIALMSYFIYLTAGNVTLAELGLLAQPDGLTGLYGAGQTSVLGIQTVDTGVFGGVLLGLLTAHVYDHTCKKAHKGILGGVFSGERWSFTCMASLASVTEPMDFLFCFSAPVLWLAHAAISGAFIVLLHLCHVTAFTSNLLGSLAMNLSAGAARTHYPVLYLLGLAQIAVYFVVFTALIKALDLPTPGRRPEEPVRPEAAPLDDAGVEKLIAALGGRENICTVDNCFTRLRVTVQDAAFVREQALRELPCSGVVQNGCNVQIVFGIRAPQVRQAVEQRLDRVVC